MCLNAVMLQPFGGKDGIVLSCCLVQEQSIVGICGLTYVEECIQCFPHLPRGQKNAAGFLCVSEEARARPRPPRLTNEALACEWEENVESQLQTTEVDMQKKDICGNAGEKVA